MKISVSHRCLVSAGLAAGLVCVVTRCFAAESAEEPWPAPVPGFVPVQPGEHPRLLFRKADIPALRQKAEIPNGKAIITHLKVLLGGGDAMPTVFSKEPAVNTGGKNISYPPGAFTISHGAGFGMLYQLTGDRKYAELSRQCVEKLFQGQVDTDTRYNLLTPGTGFRLGAVYQGIALAYDLCYDGWPADYRKSLVERLQTIKPKKVDKDQYFSLEDLAKAGGYPPGSNHFGAYILGPGMVALAFKGDPGADDKRLDAILATSEESLKRQLGGGFGDHGWFAEGTACGRISSNGILPLIESLKVAGGKDYISPRPAGRYTVLRLMHEIVRLENQPEVPARGDYGNDRIWQWRHSISFEGDFAMGMGAVLPDEARAMAWIYDHFGEPGEKKNWDSDYPHQAIYAFVNWPGTTLEPDKLLPKVIVDDIHGYYVCRNRWQDEDDTVVTTLLKRGPRGYKSGQVRGGNIVWSFGRKMDFGSLSGKTTHFRAGADGSMELSDEKGGSLVVDFSATSGAPVLLATTGKINLPRGPKGKVDITAAHVVNAGGMDVTVLTFSPPPAEKPTVKADGAEITVGQQTIDTADGKLSLGQFTEAKK
jgi:hypothetical protein